MRFTGFSTDASTGRIILTAAILKHLDACEYSVEAFEARYPNGLPLTATSYRRIEEDNKKADQDYQDWLQVPNNGGQDVPAHLRYLEPQWIIGLLTDYIYRSFDGVRYEIITQIEQLLTSLGDDHSDNWRLNQVLGNVSELIASKDAGADIFRLGFKPTYPNALMERLNRIVPFDELVERQAEERREGFEAVRHLRRVARKIRNYSDVLTDDEKEALAISEAKATALIQDLEAEDEERRQAQLAQVPDTRDMSQGETSNA